MTWLDAQYALGCACLIGMLAAAVYTLWSTIGPNAGRILDALYGRPVTPATPPEIIARAEARLI